MVLAVSKVTRHFQITLPRYFRKHARIHEGDLVSFKMLKNGNLVIAPMQLRDKDQAYFWAPKAQKEIAIALEEIKKGKAKKFKNVKEAREHFGV